MKRNITDMVKHLNPEYLNDVELSDDEVSTLTEGLDLDRIRNIAQTTFTSQNEVEKKEERENADNRTTIALTGERRRKAKRNTRPSKLTLVAAMMLIICLAGTVYAAQKGYLGEIFGIDSGIPEEQILKIAEGVEDQGVVMTVEEILPAGGSVIMVVSFELTDGQSFDGWSYPAEFGVSRTGLEHEDDFFGTVMLNHLEVVEDGKKLLCIYEMQRGPQIAGEQVSITANALYSRKTYEEPVDFTLADYFSETSNLMSLEDALDISRKMETVDVDKHIQDKNALNLETFWIKPWLLENPGKDKDMNYPLPLEKDYPEFTLGGMLLIEDTLFVTVENTGEKEELYDLNSNAYIYQLKDTRSGEDIYCAGTHHIVSAFNGISEEDLPYLVPVVSYDIRETVSKGSWSVSCYVEDLENLMEIQVGTEVSIEDGSAKFNTVEISPVGVSVKGFWTVLPEMRGVPSYNPEIALLLDDGTSVELAYRGGSSEGNGETFEINYVLSSPEDEYSKLFLNRSITDHVSGVVVDGELYEID